MASRNEGEEIMKPSKQERSEKIQGDLENPINEGEKDNG